MQHGALTPTMRPHGVDNLPTEPWRFGEEAESIIREHIRFRYRLMPYLYTLAHENHTTGMPIARPLFFADPADSDLQDESDAYLLGDALLVAPVLEDGVRTVDVPLPSGDWLDIHSNAIVEGGETVQMDAPLDRIPVLIREGSIVPMRPVAPHTAAQPRDTLMLKVVPGPDAASFTLYEDDGESMAYTEGAYALTSITQSMSEAAGEANGQDLVITIGAAAGSYDGMPAERTVRASIARVDRAPDSVTVNGEPLRRRSDEAAVQRMGGYSYDAEARTLSVQARLDTRQAHRITAQDVTIR